MIPLILQFDGFLAEIFDAIVDRVQELNEIISRKKQAREKNYFEVDSFKAIEEIDKDLPIELTLFLYSTTADSSPILSGTVSRDSNSTEFSSMSIKLIVAVERKQRKSLVT